MATVKRNILREEKELRRRQQELNRKRSNSGIC